MRRIDPKERCTYCGVKRPLTAQEALEKFGYDEFTFRLNEGNVKEHTLARLDSFVDRVRGKRITYARLTA